MTKEEKEKPVDIYVRRSFGVNKVIKTTTQTHPYSSFFPEPMYIALDEEYNYNIYSSDYILCPIYSGKSKDFQIGVTGGVGKNEEKKQAVCRELGEEIGILPKNKNMLSSIYRGSYFSKKKGRINMSVFRLYIKDSIPVLDSQKGADMTTGKDTRSEKIGCFVYGKKKDILDFMKSDKIFQYHSNDRISGIAAIRVKDAIMYYDKKYR